jgi:hypothetical protein
MSLPALGIGRLVSFARTHDRNHFPLLDFERTRREIDALGLREDSLRRLYRDNATRVYKLDQAAAGSAA